MKRITGAYLQEMASSGVQTEAEMQRVYKAMGREAETFAFDTEAVGSHTLHRWQSRFAEDVLLEGTMAIPSARFYYMAQSARGVLMDIPHLGRKHIRQGEYNLYFAKEECCGDELFCENDLCEFITIAVSEQDFQAMAEAHPEVFMAHFERYCKGKDFFLSEKPCYSCHTEVREVLRQLSNHTLLGDSAKVYADLKGLELFLLLFSEVEGQRQTAKASVPLEALHEVQRLITADLLHTPSIAELSRAVGLNHNKLCNGFKEAFGTTVYGYLFEHKMQLARRLLTETDMNVSEVAWECGYTYVSHFSKAFKKRWGETASEVREQ